ncbi:hypothetical protein T4E_2683 [Trichinella pseudospiralis]|uniref:Uncharacterized protein n=1 Tax=Trichinella pseudospiralis TaxID=6337 RepID=A0A0V0YIA1_TRIPS|nr:hypothetical protein T4E_2683 [Trichinella pseudospiralis]
MVDMVPFGLPGNQIITDLSWNLLNVNAEDMKNLPTTQMIFDRFRIRRKLSNGGSGVVYDSTGLCYWRRRSCISELRQFMGLVSVYPRFVGSFANYRFSLATPEKGCRLELIKVVPVNICFIEQIADLYLNISFPSLPK